MLACVDSKQTRSEAIKNYHLRILIRTPKLLRHWIRRAYRWGSGCTGCPGCPGSCCFCFAARENKYRFHPLSPATHTAHHPQWLPNKGSERRRKKKIQPERKKTTHQRAESTPRGWIFHPHPQPDNARRRWRSWLRFLGLWEARTPGLQDSRTPGLIQAARATIKISKIHHWKNGRKKKLGNNNNAPLPWPCFFCSLVFFYFLLGFIEGGENVDLIFQYS